MTTFASRRRQQCRVRRSASRAESAGTRVSPPAAPHGGRPTDIYIRAESTDGATTQCVIHSGATYDGGRP